MLSSILSGSTYAKCRNCCIFEEQSAWELPTFSVGAAARLADHPEINEVIVATNQTAEGNATALYLSRMLGPSGIKVSRLASGLPMGSDIEYADDLTLLSALKGRVTLTGDKNEA